MSISGSDISVRIKKQSALGTPASGAGATEIEVRPSQGLQRAVATIESGIIRRSGMRLKSRQGSITATSPYETELRKKNIVDIAAAVLGNTVTAPITVTQAALTSAAISGTGTVVTFGGGSAITQGLRAGMLGRFTGMTNALNNGVWFPILAVTATTLSVPSGYLVDEAADTSFSLVTASTISTPTPRLKEWFTIEQWVDSLSIGKLGTDMRATNLQLSAAPNAPVTVGFGFTGRDMNPTSVENFTSPTGQTGNMMVMLDGALYRNGIAALELTQLTLGLSANASITPLLMSRIGVDVNLSMFGFAGQLSGIVENNDALEASVDEDQISLMALFAEQGAAGEIVSVYAGDCSYGQVNDPIADGDQIYQATLYGGEDQRGTGFLPSTWVISYTAT